MVIHYEALTRFHAFCKLINIKGRVKVAVGTVWVLIAHVIEVWVFGICYYFLINRVEQGQLITVSGESANGLLDTIYFSFISYTSLGYGDIVPEGMVRFLAGTESLLGLVFIAWSASFLYLKMEENWKEAN